MAQYTRSFHQQSRQNDHYGLRGAYDACKSENTYLKQQNQRMEQHINALMEQKSVHSCKMEEQRGKVTAMENHVKNVKLERDGLAELLEAERANKYKQQEVKTPPPPLADMVREEKLLEEQRKDLQNNKMVLEETEDNAYKAILSMKDQKRRLKEERLLLGKQYRLLREQDKTNGTINKPYNNKESKDKKELEAVKKELKEVKKGLEEKNKDFEEVKKGLEQQKKNAVKKYNVLLLLFEDLEKKSVEEKMELQRKAEEVNKDKKELEEVKKGLEEKSKELDMANKKFEEKYNVLLLVFEDLKKESGEEKMELQKKGEEVNEELENKVQKKDELVKKAKEEKKQKKNRRSWSISKWMHQNKKDKQQ
ncbi:uncharacterized protein PF3D7_1120000-like [Embiotoca jacksoni]|uniref:uncharacterized protein PF3D7_1120000-like n=1 Tax=Embiotoca jacksoni TaxID=100190 RepID=UPI003703DB9D